MEISLGTVFRILRKYLILIIVFALVGAIGAYAASVYAIKPVYVSQAKINIVAGSGAAESGAPAPTFNPSLARTEQLLAMQSAKTCNSILMSADYTKLIREKAALDHEPKIEFTCDDETTVITVKASDNEPQTAYEIAQCVVETAGEWISDKTFGSVTVTDIETPKLPKAPASPNPVKNAVLAAMLCAVLIFIIEVLREIFGTKVKNEDELTKRYGDIPVIASIPDFNESVKRSSKYYYYNSYGSKGEK